MITRVKFAKKGMEIIMEMNQDINKYNSGDVFFFETLMRLYDLIEGENNESNKDMSEVPPCSNNRL